MNGYLFFPLEGRAFFYQEKAGK